jgi:hypothetical protein
MLKIVPEVPADAKVQRACSVAQATSPPPARRGCVINIKSFIKGKIDLVIGFDI